MIKQSLFLAISFLAMQVVCSQTFVSGGIYSNTTWTKINSPYIVVGNIVVFPDKILTIEPGVIVKFDDSYKIEIRQSQIIAEGTNTDSITFTSNSLSPFAGIWDMFYLDESTMSRFSYCKFNYANYAISGWTNYLSVNNSLFEDNNVGINSGSNTFTRVDNCAFMNNTVGIDYDGGIEIDLKNSSFINNQTGFVNGTDGNIQNCIFDSNAIVGIQKHSGTNDVVYNNIIRNNGTGYFATSGGGGGVNYIKNNVIENNNIGIHIYAAGANQDAFSCNKICNNLVYNVKYELSSNADFSQNFWCGLDSASIAATIYDGYDNIEFGLVIFMPVDTIECYLLLGINDKIPAGNNSFKIYPNPFKQYTILEFENQKDEKYKLSIYNSFGQLIFSKDNIVTGKIKIERNEMTAGMYFFQLQKDRQIITTGKFIVE